ncbi:MAG TPA: FHA domain-containing protein [Gemmataceae bacterium]|nr:FHA domain-containing protein [Gemmataceae bacterium]
MDDAKQTVQGGEPPSSFVPLKLVLQPSGPVVELGRPDMVMGRHSQADVRLPLPDVSRRHCRFVFANGTWQVHDLDSLNGVFVNGKRVQQATLRDRDTLTIGGFRFSIERGGETTDASSLESSEAIIRRIADAVPQTAPDLDSQRKAS